MIACLSGIYQNNPCLRRLLVPQDRNTTVGKKACGLIQSKYLSTNKYGKRAIEMENS